MSGPAQGLEQAQAWQFLGATVPGSSHLRQGIPNQDAWASARLDKGLLLAVSDGHGSPHCFRSDVGSRAAVEVFVELLSDFLAGSYGEDLSLVKRLAEERLPTQIERAWQGRILDYHQAHPVSEAEWATLAEKKGSDSVRRMQDQPLMIYGATLLGAVITDQYIMYLQLGDGEIVEADGEARANGVMPEDKRLIANETTSLCRSEAWRDFRFRFQVLTEAAPILLLLTTDGYFNSFRERSGFYQVATDLLDLLREEGPDWVAHELPGWLSEATHSGSGDDATLAIAWHQPGLDALPRTERASEAKQAAVAESAVTEPELAEPAAESPTADSAEPAVAEPVPEAEPEAEAATEAATEAASAQTESQAEPAVPDLVAAVAHSPAEQGVAAALLGAQAGMPEAQAVDEVPAEAASAPEASDDSESERQREADMVTLIAAADDDEA